MEFPIRSLVHAWFRDDARRYAYSLILSKRALSRGIFKRQALKELLETHTRGVDEQGYRIWALLTLELWFREYFD
jgi:asparagine synthase (glutamine-hydrolysing)